MNQQQDNSTPPPPPPVPATWSANDTWLGLALLILIVLGYAFGVSQLEATPSLNTLSIALFEFLLLIPIAIIFLWRKVSWQALGLKRFDNKDLALGCGLLIMIYFVTIINNLLMIALGVAVQVETITEMFNEMDSPLIFAVSTVLLAPFTEELFFRGFLFKGLREKYGWVNALMFSSIIFALFHGQLATLLPTFLMGALFAYMFQKTGSVFPGMLLHFSINAFSTTIFLIAAQMGLL
ncbi:MAG: CPBP family intramembrane metalloprotease [Anaerolineae bacterium]|nr:CPBP family intramembrane metalloprotease [Anaerolineae bacterium]